MPTPMLAYNGAWELSDLRYPLAVTPKLDGIRCLIQNGRTWTRDNKDIPSRRIRALLENKPELEFCDGEIVIPGATFHETQSIIMTVNAKIPDNLQYIVFDYFGEPQLGYTKRYNHYLFNKSFNTLTPVLVDNEKQLKMTLEENKNYEGSIIRCPTAPYKFGRSTLKELGMIKYVKWETDEAVVIKVKQLVENSDPSTYRQANLRVLNLCGSLVVKHLTFGEFNLGVTSWNLQKEFWKKKPID